MDLPTVNSTTSISDNVDLKNYYEDLLFKNNSGKSLSDLPRKQNDNSNNSGSDTVDPLAGLNNLRNSIKSAGNGMENRRTFDDIDFMGRFPYLPPVPNQQQQPFSHQNGFIREHPSSNLTSFQMSSSNSEPMSAPPISSNNNNLNSTQMGNYQAQQRSFPQFNGNSFHSNGNDLMGNRMDSDYMRLMNKTNIGFTSNSGSNFAAPSHSAGNPSSMNNQQVPSFNWQQPSHPESTIRRSSYISDTLINHQMPDARQKQTSQVQQQHAQGFNLFNSRFNYDNLNSTHLTANGVPEFGNGVQPPYPYDNEPNNASISNSNNNNNSHNMVPMQQFRRNTQPVASFNPSLPTFQQQQQQPQQPQQPRNVNVPTSFNGERVDDVQLVQLQRSSSVPSSTNSHNLQNENSNEGNVSLDNGLVLIQGKHLTSSKTLHDLYSDCGSGYFASSAVFEFTDNIKKMLKLHDSNESYDAKNMGLIDEEGNTYQSLLNFLDILRSCNMNYVNDPESNNGIVSNNGGNKNRRKGSFTTELSCRNANNSFLPYTPLVLVALKNGKLELLSTPQATNLLLKRGDLVIIDGDRGRDLVLVVEPSVDLNLALFINFLKKKIHFDSLITSESQHYRNDEFIQMLIDSKNGQKKKLNPKLYDVVELTELIIPSKQVLRFATPWEVTTNLHNKFEDELKALHIAQSKLQALNDNSKSQNTNDSSSNNFTNAATYSKPKLNIKILNAEFQFDRKKLTFYYVCEERNDFRDLIKELFKYYKTRIWLCAIPNNLSIDSKYYDKQQKELKLYQNIVKNYNAEDLMNVNEFSQNRGNNRVNFAPPLNEIELDNFQIAVYEELVHELFH
ncbi:BMC_2a_G0013610.mRNA.1.CDS.1 [Saccharomyces cerevisiae]|nr:Psp1p [Saccharomyces cerevisiae YJM1447]CAI4379225.1 BMC_2a_G0013610.mRNA.1.CDS.1 [Saccharomyces cerevisiae]CAI4382447.1 BMB_G0013580.mRNA.1.CDS.1 [Saccharomyces cerevisiae]CAI7086010.1 BMC_2a_G0013610.mRNA.1.CDS.1 [Saccharomyces cerevisiae]CAI7087274.1 BMB_G0013580.mRNA.1.CDS.1 [Saccharomyces cerevisiae]